MVPDEPASGIAWAGTGPGTRVRADGRAACREDNTSSVGRTTGIAGAARLARVPVLPNRPPPRTLATTRLPHIPTRPSARPARRAASGVSR